ncbi:hypothetical protein CATRI_08620 [Corynebacterium atrinae]|uniref:hypothetical protein n=1 Tax=Corynebacterium atrinae TaxID=1336740 RepID=UPI0025B560D8|nr:hypothetical protein [Corynebacterium atrinae]WJY63796.1 hypothetical protein CATRI_08620 [Corynebacterium atrinae]
MNFSTSRRFPRPILAAASLVASTTLLLSACTAEQDSSPTVENAVGLPVDASRVVVESLGDPTNDPAGDTGAQQAQVIAFRDATPEGEDVTDHTFNVEVAEGFNQFAITQDKLDVNAPAGGDVQTMRLPLTGATRVAAEANTNNQERAATRDVSLVLGQPSNSNLELTDDVRSTEGFLVGWRAEDNGAMSTVRLAAPQDATDNGRAVTEQALLKLMSLPVEFPTEEISEGARWTVDSRVTGESTLLQTTTYTVTSIQGDTVTLDVKVQQRPAISSLSIDGLPGAMQMTGETLNVLHSNTTSEGTLTVDLTKPLPIDGRVSFTTRVVYGGQDPTIRIVQDSTTSLAFTEG